MTCLNFAGTGSRLYVAFVMTWYLAFTASGRTAKAVRPVISGKKNTTYKCRAGRFVCNDYQQTTIASGLIHSLNWDMLSTRRKIARVCVLHKAIGGHLAIPVSDCLRPATRATRHSNPNSYIPISTQTECYKYSFFPRTSLDWNSLPNSNHEIKDHNIFKTLAHLHFQQEDIIRNQIRD